MKRSIFVVVDGLGRQVWPFKYAGKNGYNDADEAARSLRQTIPSAHVIEQATSAIDREARFDSSDGWEID